jgi:hypothetical protein
MALRQMENDGVFTAGQIVGPGTYRRVDVPNGRVIDVPRSGALPASLDGTIALYRRVFPIDVREAVGASAASKPLSAID